MVNQERFKGQFLKGEPKKLQPIDKKCIGLPIINFTYLSRNGKTMPRKGCL